MKEINIGELIFYIIITIIVACITVFVVRFLSDKPTVPAIPYIDKSKEYEHKIDSLTDVTNRLQIVRIELENRLEELSNQQNTIIYVTDKRIDSVNNLDVNQSMEFFSSELSKGN